MKSAIFKTVFCHWLSVLFRHLPLQTCLNRSPSRLRPFVPSAVAGKSLHFGVPLDSRLAYHPLQGKLALLPLGGSLQDTFKLLVGPQALQADGGLDLLKVSAGVAHPAG